MAVSLNLISLLRKCSRTQTPADNFLRNIHCTTAGKMERHISSRQCEEIRIEVPWGHVAAKWWGTKSVRPILGCHGWQDNAGTFDTLAPMLPDHVGFLTIDWPGHGLSSRMPHGVEYAQLRYVYLIRLLMKHYNWDKISYIGHSMSSALGFVFSAMYPDKIDMMVGIDMLKPLVAPPTEVVNRLANNMDKFMLADQRNMINSEPPSYTYEECYERFFKGLSESVDRDKCCYILDRSLQRSEKDPNKYFFTRDNRLRYGLNTISQELCMAFAERITSTPYLFIKAKRSPYYEDEKNYFDILNTLQKSNPNFECHNIDGKHHLHLNEPEKVADLISDFIHKYRPAGDNS